MGKFYMISFSLCCCLLGQFSASAQCPTPGQVEVRASNAQSFDEGTGELTFRLAEVGSFERDSFRIRLWDEAKESYVYDDNAPPFLNITEPTIKKREITFSRLPKGNYSLELHGGGCEYMRYPAGQSSGNLSN
jgi:hypothetical protein